MILDKNIWNGVVSESSAPLSIEAEDLTEQTIANYAKIIKDLTGEYREILDAANDPEDLIPAETPDWAVPEGHGDVSHRPGEFVPAAWDPIPHRKGPLTLLSLWVAYHKLPSVTRATRRVYRAALTMGIQAVPGIDAATALIILASTRHNLELCPEPEASWVKLKGVPTADAQRLFEYLNALRSEAARNVSLWLKAGMLMGFRPGEWRSAKLFHDAGANETYIMVRNAKHTHGRAPGEYRECDISDFKPDEKATLARFIEVCNQHSETDASWERFFNQSRRALQRANERLWPRRKTRISLYSARHAFSARAKKSRSQQQIAALMGHKSDETAQIHYGQRKSLADGGEMSVPIARGDAIKLVISTKEPRLPISHTQKQEATRHD